MTYKQCLQTQLLLLLYAKFDCYIFDCFYMEDSIAIYSIASICKIRLLYIRLLLYGRFDCSLQLEIRLLPKIATSNAPLFYKLLKTDLYHRDWNGSASEQVS